MRAHQSRLLALSEAQNHRCAYCGNTMVLRIGKEEPEFYHTTYEHVKARSKGGDDTLENLVAACSLCNNIRDRMDPMRFALVLSSIFIIAPRTQQMWHSIDSKGVRHLYRYMRLAQVYSKVIEKPEDLYRRRKFSYLLRKYRSSLVYMVFNYGFPKIG